jgi:fatty-acyl-CoA synthase
MEVPLLVTDFLRRSAALYPTKTAVVDGDVRLTYADVQARANRLSNALLDLGLQKGDRVCYLGPNSHHFLESFFGTAQIGVVLVPLNYRLTAADHEYILNHAGVKAVLVDRELVSTLDAIRAALPEVEHFVVAQEESAPPAGWTAWEPWIAAAGADPPNAPLLRETDLVSINYTSGTTARPKGVMLTHRNCYVNAYGLIAHLRFAHDDVELWTLPMFHCNGWGGVYALTGMGGTHVVLRAIDAKRIFELIASEGVTVACMAPAVLSAILEYPDRDQYAMTTRPRLVIAGAPPPAAFVERLESELGWEFLQIYGLTETAPLLTYAAPDHGTARANYPRRARAGVGALGVDIAVMDESGVPVPRDDATVGEICARSNVVFDGYWKQPEETALALRDGYFRTGDLAVWDSVGNIHIVDRKKDVIISGGENISSPEVEDVLYRHPAILECAVIGVPHEKWGETPLAVVVLRPDHRLTEAEIVAYCREHLAHFKCPTGAEVVGALPRTATGKLQKFRLRERHWAGKRRVN